MSKVIKIGDKFTYVRVRIESWHGKIHVEKEILNCIGVSDCMACLDDNTFSTLALNKTFAFCHNKPEEVKISESIRQVDIDLFGRFNITIYSLMSDKIIENKLNREFKKWLDKKLGAYGCAEMVKIKLNKLE